MRFILFAGILALFFISVSSICFDEDNGDPFNPIVTGVYNEVAKVYINFETQSQLDENIFPGNKRHFISSYDYDPLTLTRYAFHWRDTVTNEFVLVEGEFWADFLDAPDNRARGVIGFENFQPHVNRTRCEKAHPYRDQSFQSPLDLHKSTRHYLISTYGPVRTNPVIPDTNPQVRGCDYLPITHFLADKGNGALVELGITGKENTTDFDMEDYFISQGLITRWQYDVFLPGYIFGLPFDLKVADAKFYESGLHHFELVLPSITVLQTLEDAAQDNKRSTSMNFEVIAMNLPMIIASPELFKERFPQYADGIDLLVNSVQ